MEGRPTLNRVSMIDQINLNKEFYNKRKIYLQQNLIKTKDNWVFSSIQRKFKYYTYSKKDIYLFKKRKNLNKLFSMEFNIDIIAKHHTRVVYNLINIIEDVGGIIEIFFIIFGILLHNVSTFSFYVD